VSRQDRVLACRNGGIFFFDRSPVCTLALSRYAGLAPSQSLARAPTPDRVALIEQAVGAVP
jgi:predicted ATPase